MGVTSPPDLSPKGVEGDENGNVVTPEDKSSIRSKSFRNSFRQEAGRFFELPGSEHSTAMKLKLSPPDVGTELGIQRIGLCKCCRLRCH